MLTTAYWPSLRAESSSRSFSSPFLLNSSITLHAPNKLPQFKGRKIWGGETGLPSSGGRIAVIGRQTWDWNLGLFHAIIFHRRTLISTCRWYLGPCGHIRRSVAFSSSWHEKVLLPHFPSSINKNYLERPGLWSTMCLPPSSYAWHVQILDFLSWFDQSLYRLTSFHNQSYMFTGKSFSWSSAPPLDYTVSQGRNWKHPTRRQIGICFQGREAVVSIHPLMLSELRLTLSTCSSLCILDEPLLQNLST